MGYFGSRNFLGPKKFWVKKDLRPEKFRSKKTLGPKNYVPEKYGSNICFCPMKYFGSMEFLGQIFMRVQRQDKFRLDKCLKHLWNSTSAISQLLLTRFQPNFKVRFLGWTTTITKTTLTTTSSTTDHLLITRFWPNFQYKFLGWTTTITKTTVTTTKNKKSISAITDQIAKLSLSPSLAGLS